MTDTQLIKIVNHVRKYFPTRMIQAEYAYTIHSTGNIKISIQLYIENLKESYKLNSSLITKNTIPELIEAVNEILTSVHGTYIPMKVPKSINK